MAINQLRLRIAAEMRTGPQHLLGVTAAEIARGIGRPVGAVYRELTAMESARMVHGERYGKSRAKKWVLINGR